MSQFLFWPSAAGCSENTVNMLKKHSNTKLWKSKSRLGCQRKKNQPKTQTKHMAACILFWHIPALMSQANGEDGAATPSLSLDMQHRSTNSTGNILFIYFFFLIANCPAARQGHLLCLQRCSAKGSSAAVIASWALCGQAPGQSLFSQKYSDLQAATEWDSSARQVWPHQRGMWPQWGHQGLQHGKTNAQVLLK